MITWNEIWANGYRKLILSVLVFFARAVFTVLFLNYFISRIPDDSPHLYTVRKVTTYIITVAAAFLLSVSGYSVWAICQWLWVS